MKKLALAFVLFFTVFKPILYADAINTSSFVNPSIYTYEGFGLSFYNSTPITFGGNRYTADDGILRYISYNSTGICVSGACIGNNTDTGYINIALATPVQRAGGWVGASSGYVQFFNTSDMLLGQVSVSPVPYTSMNFAGWDAGSELIGRIRIYDTQINHSIVTFDNLYTESGSAPAPVPIPSTMLLLGTGIAGLAVVGRGKRS